ncbi:MAG: hypothetical protein JO041_07305 [Acidobacteria bacterium]|nr:hypothetical protein [Acidobacteriota bacterium]
MKTLTLIAGIAALFCGTAMADNLEYSAYASAGLSAGQNVSELIAGSTTADQSEMTADGTGSVQVAAAEPVYDVSGSASGDWQFAVTEKALHLPTASGGMSCNTDSRQCRFSFDFYRDSAGNPIVFSSYTQSFAGNQGSVTDLVTEPASLALFGIAPSTIAMFIRRRRQNATAAPSTCGSAGCA